MIQPHTIQEILETSRIEEVVGEFVPLKKRGTNLLGLCPFHHEKTPSFTVSPTKGIYKCFGCGKGGNSVNFVMDHEQFSYPEALKYLAKKYGVEIEEEEVSPEEMEAQGEKEAMFNLNGFAQNYFSELLRIHEKGRAIGLSYLKERGFTETIIDKFRLGYALEDWSAFTTSAMEAGYKEKYLVSTGLTIKNEEGKTYDRFRGRAIFPIHNLSGRVVGFTGRVLGAADKMAKYVNSPESEIYHKSKVLYGLYFSKNKIVSLDKCYLVEGNTDVISLHQAGVENVVASSGTALTTDHIKLVKRYTQNITMMFDNDPAGVKASFRGIDMVLEEGLNAKVVLLPEGEDPDSFARKHSSHEITDYIEENEKDFITFKLELLLGESGGDPIRRARVVKDIVHSVGLIPDEITRSVYLKACSNRLDVPEQALMNELNKTRRQAVKKQYPQLEDLPELEVTAVKQVPQFRQDASAQEKEIIRILLRYGLKDIVFEKRNEDDRPVEVKVKVAEFIVNEILADELAFDNQVYQWIFERYAEGLESKTFPGEKEFCYHADNQVVQTAVELLNDRFELSHNWEEKHHIYVKQESNDLRKLGLDNIYYLKLRKIECMMAENDEQLKTASEEMLEAVLQDKISLNKIRCKIASILDIPVTK